ncbi:MAG: TonB-dependent receptor [Candidatus Eremiobacteraeota bacterium]|nr:TonB-dependent receptor [Candidatus Eremiobacteraeota bacterium]
MLGLAALLAILGSPLQVVDDAGNAVAGARADFVDARGAHAVVATDRLGEASPPATFDAVAVDVTKASFVAAHVTLARGTERVVLERALPTIGSVSVATGSLQTLHQLPLAASLLDRGAIALAPITSSDQLLRALPGSDRVRSNSAFTNYGQLRASFSGAGSDRGVVLVDGVPAQDAFGGQIDWQAYPAGLIERAELLRGAGSALYGSGAVGGVLDISTFAPLTRAGAPPSGRLSLAAGSNSSLDESFAVRAALGPTLAASLSGAATRLAYSDLPPAYSTPIDRPAIGESGLTQARLRFADRLTTIDAAGLFGSDHQFEGRPNYTFDRTLRQESFDASHALGGALARVTYYVRDTTVHNLSDLFPTNPGSVRYVQHVPSDENGFSATLSAAPSAVEYVLRVDQRRVDGRSEQYGPSGAMQALGTGVQLSQGVALQATLRSGGFEALVGARADRLRYDDLSLSRATGTPPKLATTTVAGHDEGAISPRVALRYDVDRKLAVRLSSGGGFRGPYLNELVRGFNVGPIFNAPNPNLVPERSRTDDAGVDYLLGRGRLAFDVIQTRVNDAIAFVTINPTTMQRANVDRTQSNGETLTYAQTFGPCTRLRVSGTSQYARVTNGLAGNIGKRLAFVPNRTASLGVDAAGRGPLSFALDGSYSGQTYADDLQQQPLGAALLFGATVRLTTTTGATIALVGSNVTHQTYLSSIDRYGPPTTVALRVGLPIGPAPSRAHLVCGTLQQ